MAEKIFQNKFHKTYVGGEGVVAETDRAESVVSRPVSLSYEDILAEYRWYMRDPEAQLPQKIVDQLKIVGKI